MTRLYGRLSVDGPVAVNRYRQKYGVGGGRCEIIITSNPGHIPAVTSSKIPSAEIVENAMKVPTQAARIVIDERQQLPKLGKLIYTTKTGETFTAYHSAVFPKIVNEIDKIVYDNKERWYEAMRVSAPVRCD